MTTEKQYQARDLLKGKKYVHAKIDRFATHLREDHGFLSPYLLIEKFLDSSFNLNWDNFNQDTQVTFTNKHLGQIFKT